METRNRGHRNEGTVNLGREEPNTQFVRHTKDDPEGVGENDVPVATTDLKVSRVLVVYVLMKRGN